MTTRLVKIIRTLEMEVPTNLTNEEIEESILTQGYVETKEGIYIEPDYDNDSETIVVNSE